MRHLKRICAGMVLTLVFSLPTFAGQIPCGGIADPPPPPPPETATATTEADGQIGTGIAEAVITLLLAMF